MKVDLSKTGYGFDFDMSYNVMPDVVDTHAVERLVNRWLPHRLSHVYKVETIVTKWSTQLFHDLPFKIMNGWIAVTSAAALLHEIMSVGRPFEDVSEGCTEFVAMSVSAMTPDIRQPKTWRTKLLSNSVGLSPPHVQFLVLADLTQSWRESPAEAREILDCLYSIKRNPIVSDEIVKLDREIRQEIGVRPSRKFPR